jgi:urate oxidase
MTLVENHYGKSRVRVARLVRRQDHHELHEMTVAIQLAGDFDSSYTAGDNSSVLPTDTMKNTVYAFAKQDDVAEPEAFAVRLGRHFVATQKQIAGAHVEIEGHLWQRHGRFSFAAPAAHRRIARVAVMRDRVEISAGVRGFVMMKTKGSAFSGYPKDRYTTLPETRDRIFCTSLDATWRYSGDDLPWNASWHGVMKLIMDTFAEHESESVQHTLYAIGEAVLEQCEHIGEITLTMPNRHYLPVNLQPFGLDAANEIFCPTDEPHGLIEATLRR